MQGTEKCIVSKQRVTRCFNNSVGRCSTSGCLLKSIIVYLVAVAARSATIFLPGWSLAPVVEGLMALRGVDLVVAGSFAVEIGDVWRLDSARQLIGYLGQVPAEWLTCEAIRQGSITKMGSCRLRQSLVRACGPICPSAGTLANDYGGRLITQHGADMGLPQLREVLAADCPKLRAASPMTCMGCGICSL